MHVLRVPIRRHHTVVYGETLHKVVEFYLRRRAAGNYTPLEDLLETFDREWRNEGFLTWEHEDARRDAGRAAIERFWHEEEASGTRPTYVEREFGLSLPGAGGLTRVRGRCDRVDETEDGPVIVDYKSSDVREPARAEGRATESLQLQIYALAWREMTGRLPGAGRAAVPRVRRGRPPRADGGGRRDGPGGRARGGGGHPRATLHGDAVVPGLPLLRLQPDLPVHGEPGRLSRARQDTRGRTPSPGCPVTFSRRGAPAGGDAAAGARGASRAAPA